MASKVTRKFYIATSLQRIEDHHNVRDALREQNWEITYDWTLHGSVKKTSIERLQEVGLKMTQGVLDADVVIVLLPGGKGTHTELGMAIARNKKIILHSMSPQPFALCDETVAFYHREDILQLTGTFDQVVEILQREFQKDANELRS